MYKYLLYYLRQPDIRTRNLSNNNSTTLFRKNLIFDFAIVSQLFLCMAGFMHKKAAINKSIDNETRTDFVSFMSDWFLEKDFDEMKIVNFKVKKTHTQKCLLKQFSVKIIKKIFYVCSKKPTSKQCRRSCLTLRDWCCWKRVPLDHLLVGRNGSFC